MIEGMTCTGATAAEGVMNDGIADVFGILQLIVVVWMHKQECMKVAIAHMTHDRSRNTAFPGSQFIANMASDNRLGKILSIDDAVGQL